MSDLRSGMVGAVENDSLARECTSFVAQVIVLSPPKAGMISPGCVLWVQCHTGQVLEKLPPCLHAGDAAVVRLRPQAPLCVEPFSEYPPLGRFSVIDQKATVAAGVVQEVEFAPFASSPKSRKHYKQQERSKDKQVASQLRHGSKAKSKSGERAVVAFCADERPPPLGKPSSDEQEDSGEEYPNLVPLFGDVGEAKKGTPLGLRTAASLSPFATFGSVAMRRGV